MNELQQAIPVYRKEAIGVFLLLGLPMAVGDGWLWFGALPRGMSVSSVLLWHLCLLAISYSAVLWFRHRGWDLRFISVMAITGTLMGPFGFALAVLAALSYGLFAGVQLDAATLLKELMPEIDEHAIAETAHRLSSGLDRVDLDTAPTPFLDIMAFGSMEQKRSVISLALRYFSPEFTSVLHAGLHDKINGIRVLSATAMVAVEKRYYERFLQLQHEVRRYPDDLGVLLAYANHCADFALSDILGEERAATMRHHAIDAYELLMQGNEASLDIACQLARLYLVDDKAEASLKVLEPYITRNSHHLVSLYCQGLFQLHRYDDLRAFARNSLSSVQDTSIAHDEVSRTLMLWTGGSHANS